MVPLEDGGFVVACGSWSLNGDIQDNPTAQWGVWVVRLNEWGGIEDQAFFPRPAGDDEPDPVLVKTLDGGFAIAANVSGAEDGIGNIDVWVLKLDADLDLQWERFVGSVADDLVGAIANSHHGGFVVGLRRGGSFPGEEDIGPGGFQLEEFTLSGDPETLLILDVPEREALTGLVATDDGGYAFCGGVANDYWLGKVDAMGALEWSMSYGGSDNESPYALIRTDDGGYAIVGETWSYDGDVSGWHGLGDVWFVKCGPTGQLEMQVALGGAYRDSGTVVIPDPNGGYVVIGHTASNEGDVSSTHGAFDAWMVKVDAMGSIEWEHCYGGSGSEEIYAGCALPDGGYAIAGMTESSDGDVIGQHGDWDAWVVRLGAPEVGIDDHTEASFQLRYDRTADRVHVSLLEIQTVASLTVHDVEGRVVLAQRSFRGTTIVDLSDVAVGVYAITVNASDGRSTQRLVKGD
jgi:hypothetical protein